MRSLILILFALSLGSVLIGCGQKGPLKLPQDGAPPPAKIAASGAIK